MVAAVVAVTWFFNLPESPLKKTEQLDSKTKNPWTGFISKLVNKRSLPRATLHSISICRRGSRGKSVSIHWKV